MSGLDWLKRSKSFDQVGGIRAMPAAVIELSGLSRDPNEGHNSGTGSSTLGEQREEGNKGRVSDEEGENSICGPGFSVC